MRKMKYFIFVLLFFMVIGFAAVSVSLSIGGNATVVTDIEDFKVYYSDVKVNDVQDLTLVKSDTELVFDINLYEPGETVVVSYDVTNASKLFDAALTVNCTSSTEYVGVTNQIDLSNLPALSTRTGKLTLKKLKSNSNEFSTVSNISCDIVASPVGRDNEASGSVIGPLPAYEYAVGTEIAIGEEKFNVISSTDTTVTLLAKYNLSSQYVQSTTINKLSFDSSSSSSLSLPQEVDIQEETTNFKNYVNGYVQYLQSVTGDESLTGDLISLTQLKKLGCTVPDNYYYEYVDDLTGTNYYDCSSSPNDYFLINGQDWWTKSINSAANQEIWIIESTGIASAFYKVGAGGGIRPTITVSKEALSKTIIEFTIEGETFYAYEGMTWGDWASNGAFSGDLYYDDGYNIWDDDLVIGDGDNNWVYSYDEISNGVDYYLIEFCCFDAGSLVMMADGTTKNIEDVKVGDLVMSLNEDTGEFISQKVTGTTINPKSTDLVYVNLSNGVRIGMRAYHPLLTTEGWKSLRPDSPDAIRENIDGLSLLEVGDTLVGYGENVTIVSVEEREEVSDYKTYNLSVEGYHNYVVEGVVAHNVACVQ